MNNQLWFLEQLKQHIPAFFCFSEQNKGYDIVTLVYTCMHPATAMQTPNPLQGGFHEGVGDDRSIWPKFSWEEEAVYTNGDIAQQGSCLFLIHQCVGIPNNFAISFAIISHLVVYWLQ